VAGALQSCCSERDLSPFTALGVQGQATIENVSLGYPPEPASKLASKLERGAAADAASMPIMKAYAAKFQELKSEFAAATDRFADAEALDAEFAALQGNAPTAMRVIQLAESIHQLRGALAKHRHAHGDLLDQLRLQILGTNKLRKDCNWPPGQLFLDGWVRLPHPLSRNVAAQAKGVFVVPRRSAQR
jgi:hypothetical protein